MKSQKLLVGAVWLGAVALAVAVVAVLTTLARSLGGGETVLSQDEAARELAAVTATPPVPTGEPPGSTTAPTDATPVRPTGIPTTTATRPAGTGPTAARTTPARPATSTSAPTVVRSRGGSVTAACTGGQAVLLAWTPAQGYAVDEVERHDAKVRFEGPDGRVEVRLRCVGGEIRAEVRQ